VTEWLGVAALASLASAAAFASLVLLRTQLLQTRLQWRAARYEEATRALLWKLTGIQLLRLQAAGCAGAAALWALQRSPLWGVAFALCLAAPSWWMARRTVARRLSIEAQLDTWLLMLANALRASPALADALRASAALVPAPLRDELELTLREYRLGIGLDRALEQMGQRLGSRLVATAVALIVVSRNTGGDLCHALETSAASLRELIRLDGVLRAKTAEGKAQATLIALIPFALVLIIDSVDPQFFAPLADTALGQLIVCGSAVLWLLAVWLARRIVQPEP
jgi:tight adherence protein B